MSVAKLSEKMLARVLADYHHRTDYSSTDFKLAGRVGKVIERTPGRPVGFAHEEFTEELTNG